MAELHATTRAKFWWLAQWIDESIPEGRERALVFTKLEEALMWSNAAIARHDWSQQ